MTTHGCYMYLWPIVMHNGYTWLLHVSLAHCDVTMATHDCSGCVGGWVCQTEKHQQLYNVCLSAFAEHVCISCQMV